MNPKTEEDVRTLAQFYSDPIRRHGVHTGFTHRFLPQYIQQNPFAFFSYVFNPDLPGGRQEPTRFIQSRWSMIFEDSAGLVPREGPGGPMVFRRVSDLSMSLVSLAGKPLALIKMPPPERAPEAFFVGVVLLADIKQPGNWPRDVQARVFTLERTLDGGGSAGRVCEWLKDGTHRNFSLEVAAERKGFLQVVETLVGRPPAPSPAPVPTPTPPPAMGSDAELEQMLAKPEFLPEPVFSKDQYLTQAARGLLGHYLRLAKQPPEIYKQIQQAHFDANSICLMVRISLVPGKSFMIVAWTLDLDAHGQPGIDGYAARARMPVVNVINPTSNQMKEHVLGRRVIRIQVEPEGHTPKSPPGAQIVRVKKLGWYVAALIPPMQKAP